jgi:hypothetical protein
MVQEETAITKQRLDEHTGAAADTHSAIEYSEDHWEMLVSSSVKDSQSRQRVKYDHELLGTRNYKSLREWKSVAILESQSQSEFGSRQSVVGGSRRLRGSCWVALFDASTKQRLMKT